MKLLILFLTVIVCFNQVAAGGDYNDNPQNPDNDDKAKKCAGQPDSHSCKAEACHWHIGHCTNTFNCSQVLTPEDCLSNEICIQTETDNGNCNLKVQQCGQYGYADCLANNNTCSWISSYSCEAVPGFVTNCQAKTIEECRTADYCTYTSVCTNNYYPYKSWCYCREECLADQFSTWVVLHPAYCIDNVHFCANLTVDDCRAHAEHCVVERYYGDCKNTYNYCSNDNSTDYYERCIALRYGCEALSIEDCQNNELCKVIDEIGQCYPKKLPNCETLSADDCAANSHCCLREQCSDNPQIIECPAKTISECQVSQECRVVDYGQCSGQIFNCNIPKEQCLNATNFCDWTSNITYSCDNRVHCDNFDFYECWDYCEECDWHKDACKHHP